MRRFDDEDLTGAEFRECDLSRARLVGVVMQDAEIDGLFWLASLCQPRPACIGDGRWRS